MAAEKAESKSLKRKLDENCGIDTDLDVKRKVIKRLFLHSYIPFLQSCIPCIIIAFPQQKEVPSCSTSMDEQTELDQFRNQALKLVSIYRVGCYC